MPYISPAGSVSQTTPALTQKQPKPPVSSPAATISSATEDTVDIQPKNQSKPATRTSSIPDAAKIQGVDQATEAAEKTAANPAPKSKPFYQAIIDFFQKLGQKIMDIFTPTSKEAIEKALIKANLKAHLQAGRIARNAECLKDETHTAIEKAALEQDTQKAKKKLAKTQSKHEKLSKKFQKHELKTTKAESKPAPQTTSEKPATPAAGKTTKQTTSESVEKVTQEAAEHIKPENAIADLLDNIVKNPEAAMKKAESLVPEIEQFFVNIIQKMKP
jgi:hypothetical protein